MIQIGLALPYPDAEPLARQVFQAHNEFLQASAQDAAEYELLTFSAVTTDEFLTNAPPCDVMIVRGGTYRDLCKVSYPVPIVELIISGSDIVEVLLRLRHQYPHLPAAILGTQNMLLGIEQLREQLSVDVVPYILRENSCQEVHRNVDAAVQDGKKVIIGGQMGLQRAQELGVRSIQILSSWDSFWNAISEAKQIAKISLEERAKALSLQTLLDNAYEGLLAVDQNQTITFLNAAAIRILQLSDRRQYLGKKASDVLSSPSMIQMLSSSREYHEEIIQYQSTHLSAKKVNLFMHGASTGSVLTMLNASQIQRTEGKLRNTLHYKGHFARYTFSQVLTRSPKMQECLEDAKAYALTDSNIVLVGESGTGKELISQSIHNWSRRSKNNFVAINCAALPENLLESELFGYVDGAFTGAAKGGKPGLFEIAHNGTIFLDEISELPLSLQGRLLRVLQEREIMRLGDSKVIPIDIRVIAATNKNLQEMVQAGSFRQDLYYRLYVLQLNLPPLRARKEDIPLLTDAFLKEFQAKAQFPAQIQLTSADYARLTSLPWLGNVRELRNFCERMAVLYRPGTSPSDLLSHLLQGTCSEPSPQAVSQSAAPSAAHGRRPLPSPQRIEEALRSCQGNKTLTAQRLGISRVTLWRILKQQSGASSYEEEG